MPLFSAKSGRHMSVKAPPKREQALYVQLAESFRRRIATKDWQIGLQLPNGRTWRTNAAWRA